MERDPYAVLGCSEAASWPEVRSAYRRLARRYHPDGTHPDRAAMTAVNTAYDALERVRLVAEGRRPPDDGVGVPVGPGRAASSTWAGSPGASTPPPSGPPAGSLLWRMTHARGADSPVLDFGQYAGWRIADVARHDPRYLAWLSRHSSGVRFRDAIAEALGGTDRDLGRPAAILR